MVHFSLYEFKKKFFTVLVILCNEWVANLEVISLSVESITYGMVYLGDWDAVTVDVVTLRLLRFLVLCLWVGIGDLKKSRK